MMKVTLDMGKHPFWDEESGSSWDEKSVGTLVKQDS